MFANPAWTVDVTRVLTRRELATVLADARTQAERSLNAQRNLIIVRLACCCGSRPQNVARSPTTINTMPMSMAVSSGIPAMRNFMSRDATYIGRCRVTPNVTAAAPAQNARGFPKLLTRSDAAITTLRESCSGWR